MMQPVAGTETLVEDEPELTIRGTILGAGITIVFMAANVYLGLKTGMTFSSSIPAAIISMSALKVMGSGGILENNIIQTQASAAGTLCNVILVLPGLLLIGYWHDFSLWQTMALSLLGGLFGVAYSIPLRRVMVVESDLPFPEGVAAAEVLHAGHQGGHEGGLRDLALSAAGAAVLSLVTTGFRLMPDHFTGSLTQGRAVFQIGGSLSLALIGVGYLVRLGACLALLLGVGLAWGVAVPVLTSLAGAGIDRATAADAVWSEKVRLIGAGIIAIGGIWTVVTLIKPMISSIRSAFRANSRKGAPAAKREDRDVPIVWVGGAIAGLCIPTAVLFAWFAEGVHLTGSLFLLVAVLTVLTAFFGFLMAAACGYMAGLLGSSSSPISGIGILSTMLVAVAFGFAFPGAAHDDRARFVVALTLFITSVIVTMASIANDNLQDLKTGRIVGATPWRQQAALVIGVVVGAVTIAPVLGLLYRAYGFPGSLPRPGMNPADVMAAPQAALMTQIATGIVHHQLAWAMVFIGAALGAVLVALEALLRRKGFSLPALTVGIGMYLPAPVVVTIAAGGILGWLGERALSRQRRSSDDGAAKVRRRGVLMASGFLVGESLMGVCIAACDALGGRSGALAVHGFAYPGVAMAGGLVAFAAALVLFYRATSRPA